MHISLKNYLLLLLRRLWGFEVPDLPQFHSEVEILFFERFLKEADVFLEFGSGGSTIFATNLMKRVYTVEGDFLYMRAVAKKIKKNRKSFVINKFFYRDIGFIGPWGTPVRFQNEIRPGLKIKYRAYSDMPISFGEIKPTETVVVLIDGKFRVACALKTLLAFDQIGLTSYKMLFDDYLGRTQYHVVEDFMRKEQVVGELACFAHPGNIDREALTDAIRKYELVCD